MFVFAFLFLFLLWQSYVINKEVFLVGDRAMFLNFSNGPSAENSIVTLLIRFGFEGHLVL